MKTTILSKEIHQFQKDSQNWHDPNGPFAPLHAINPLRLGFIRDVLEKNNGGTAPDDLTPLSGKQILDIGCGGGLLCEPLARLGGAVTGLDADDQAIRAAQAQAALTGSLSLTYHAQPVEAFRAQNPRAVFDIVTAMEIIEHVADTNLFLDELAPLVRPKGFLFMSTLNRTIKSYLLGVLAAEYILGLVPRGTHSWRQFVKPSSLTRALRARGFTPISMTGISYHPLSRTFYLTPQECDVNYMMAFQKEG